MTPHPSPPVLALNVLEGIAAEVSVEYCCEYPLIEPAATEVAVALISVTADAGDGSVVTQVVPLLVE